MNGNPNKAVPKFPSKSAERGDPSFSRRRKIVMHANESPLSKAITIPQPPVGVKASPRNSAPRRLARA